MSLNAGNNLEDALSHHGVKKKDLERECSKEVRIRIATKLADWKKLGHYLKLSKEKLYAIDQENETEDQRKIALLDAWDEKERQGASMLVLAEALCRQQRQDLVGLLCDVVTKLKPAADEVQLGEHQLQLYTQGIDSDGKIKVLQEQFDGLHLQLLSKLEAEGIRVDDLFQALSLLRISIKNKFDSSIGELLPKLSKGESDEVAAHFCNMKPLLPFINCGLLQHLIQTFGDVKLKRDMDAYAHEIDIFMKETTVGEMIINISSEKEPHVNYTLLRVEFNESPNFYPLERLTNFKREFCNKVCQSEFAFGLKLLEPGSSFFASSWLVPSVIISKLKEFTQNRVDQTFYERENVILVSLEGWNGPELLYTKVAASQMSVDNAERIISLLSESLLMVINCSDNLIPLNLLQRICSLLDTIISQMSTPTQLGLPVSPSVIVQCKNIADLNCICHLQIKIISGFPLTIDKNVQQYWYFKGLQSAYECFRCLKLRKVIQVEKKYFYNLLSSTIDCLIRIQQKEILMPMLLQLFRIAYACLSGLPIESLNASDLVLAVTPYFRHTNKDVKVAALNVGQFLIPAIGGSKPIKQLFILNEDSICSILSAFGKSMPNSSSLKLLHSFSALPENCGLFMNKGIALLSTSIMVLSPRQIEKELAFHLLKRLIQGHISSTQSLVADDLPLTSQQIVCPKFEIEATEQRVEDALQALSIKLERLLHEDLSLLQEKVTNMESLLKCLKNDLSRCEESRIEALTRLLLQCTQRIIESLPNTRHFGQLKLLSSLIFSFYDFLKEFVNTIGGSRLIDLQECTDDIMAYIHSSILTEPYDLSTEDMEHTAIGLLKSIITAIDHFSFACTSQMIQDCARIFSSSLLSDLRIISITIINKVDPISELLKSCAYMINDDDVAAIVLHLQKQSLLPTLDLLNLLNIASQHTRICRSQKVIEILNTVAVDDVCKQKVKEVKQNLLSLAQNIVPEQKSVEDLLPQLADYLGHFKCIVAHMDVSTREPFVKLKGLLNDLDQTVYKLEASLSCRVNHQLINLLLGAINDLLPAVIETTETQHQRWGNFIMFSCWVILKRLVKKKGVLLKSQALHVIDTVLRSIASYGRKDKHGEIALRTIDFCLGVIQDFLFDEICDQLGGGELSGIKSSLIMNKTLHSLTSFKFELQVILAHLCTDEENDLKKELVLDQTIVTGLMPMLRSFKDPEQLNMMLRKIRSLASIAENRQLFRKFGLLQSLGTLLEQYANSATEFIIAELIFHLLSDAPDSEMVEEEDVNPIALFEEFMTVFYEGRKQMDETVSIVDVGDILKATSGENSKQENTSELVVLHARCIHGLMAFTKDAFPMALNQPDQVIQIAMLVRAVQHMKKLCIAYEKEMNTTELELCKKQIVYVHKERFPEFFYLSFKALQDLDSESLSDIDRGVYKTVLLEYLQFLHFIIEQWSRMNGVQELLLECGAFYLLFNELHTESTTHVLNEDILYSALTVLYNVSLNSELSLRFRIVMTKQLLKQFFTKSSPSLKFIAKFSFSCLHRILSRSELRQLALDKVEVNMLARCLNGIDNFFGGYENLLLTLTKLAHFPENWTLFVNGGIVHALMSLALTESGHTKVLSVRALLNMIPEASIPESHSQKEAPLSKSRYEKSPTNQVTKIITGSPAFMEFVMTYEAAGICKDLCLGIKLLTTPLQNTDKPSILVLDRLERYPDCWRFCEIYLSTVPESENRNEILFYKAKSMYQEYNRELPELIEKCNTSTGFEYKNMMHNFCQKRILEVIQILTPLVNHYKKDKESDVQCSFVLEDKYDEMVTMLDKALLDYLIFNMTEVRTCVLCHSVVDKLVHSHYIPKSIIQEFEKAMGIDQGKRIYVFSPSGHPSSWNFKSAGQLTFSMLCKTCDCTILSQDENNFKKYIFDIVYASGNPDSVKLMHTIPYDLYLLRFAAGLLFRCIAPLYSQVSAEIGNFKELHQMMQVCQSIVLEPAIVQSRCIKIFLLALPSNTPKPLITPGWDKFVAASLSPYLAYKLFLPGKVMLPKRLLCCMVKIGVLLFVTSFDHDLEIQLLRCCSHSLISSGISDSKILYIPNEEVRATCIPEKLWWSLVGWAKKEVNTSLSTVLSVVPQSADRLTHSSQVASSVLASVHESSDPRQDKASGLETIVANMLPPGFSLNFNEHNTLPEKVIELPAGHTVLLHQPFQTSKRAECFAVLGKLKEDTNTQGKTKATQPAYSWLLKPYILIYLRQAGRDNKSVLKVGFYINETEYNVEGALPGCPPKMIESPHLQEIIIQVPGIIHSLLRCKGFLSLKSLLFWYESVRNAIDSQERIPSTLDTRCWQKNCNYCDMRCDCCLKPCLDRYEVKSFSKFGSVQSCSRECSNILFEDADGCNLQRIPEDSKNFVPNGHVELYRGKFSTTSQVFPGLSSKIIFSICQSKGQDHSDYQSLPPTTKYIKFWQKSLEKPFCIEYTIDDQFNALEMIHFQGSRSVFSPGEERELMYQFHDMLIRFGIPYRLAQIELST